MAAVLPAPGMVWLLVMAAVLPAPGVVGFSCAHKGVTNNSKLKPKHTSNKDEEFSFCLFLKMWQFP
jgi:hypothetical protein